MLRTFKGLWRRTASNSSPGFHRKSGGVNPSQPSLGSSVIPGMEKDETRMKKAWNQQPFVFFGWSIERYTMLYRYRTKSQQDPVALHQDPLPGSVCDPQVAEKSKVSDRLAKWSKKPRNPFSGVDALVTWGHCGRGSLWEKWSKSPKLKYPLVI